MKFSGLLRNARQGRERGPLFGNDAGMSHIPFFCFLQVALCAGCNAIHPFAAFIIGIIAGMAYVAWSTAMLYFKIDDPLDAVAGNRAF